MRAHEELFERARSRRLIYVSEALYAEFWRHWRAIEQEWLGCGMTLESLDAFSVIRAAREDLRKDAITLSKQGHSGRFPIVV
jgi:hypothetical protein